MSLTRVVEGAPVAEILNESLIPELETVTGEGLIVQPVSLVDLDPLPEAEHVPVVSTQVVAEPERNLEVECQVEVEKIVLVPDTVAEETAPASDSVAEEVTPALLIVLRLLKRCFLVTRNAFRLRMPLSLKFFILTTRRKLGTKRQA